MSATNVHFVEIYNTRGALTNGTPLQTLKSGQIGISLDSSELGDINQVYRMVIKDPWDGNFVEVGKESNLYNLDKNRVLLSVTNGIVAQQMTNGPRLLVTASNAALATSTGGIDVRESSIAVSAPFIAQGVINDTIGNVGQLLGSIRLDGTNGIISLQTVLHSETLNGYLDVFCNQGYSALGLLHLDAGSFGERVKIIRDEFTTLSTQDVPNKLCIICTNGYDFMIKTYLGHGGEAPYIFRFFGSWSNFYA